MFEVVENTVKEVGLVYIAILSACLLTYPFVRLIVSAATKGAEK